MKKIDEIATLAGLQSARISRNADLMEAFLTSSEVQEQLGMKRIQFETSPILYERLEGICGLLDVSKREFMESALVDAINAADEKFNAVYQEVTGREFGSEVEA